MAEIVQVSMEVLMSIQWSAMYRICQLRFNHSEESWMCWNHPKLIFKNIYFTLSNIIHSEESLMRFGAL